MDLLGTWVIEKRGVRQGLGQESEGQAVFEAVFPFAKTLANGFDLLTR